MVAQARSTAWGVHVDQHYFRVQVLYLSEDGVGGPAGKTGVTEDRLRHGRAVYATLQQGQLGRIFGQNSDSCDGHKRLPVFLRLHRKRVPIVGQNDLGNPDRFQSSCRARYWAG